MTPLRIQCTALAALALISGGLLSAEDKQPKPDTTKTPVIQMAILLDTSNSMDGLINQARSQLWKVVNEFATARRGDQLPDLQVAVYQYGNSKLNQESGWVQQALPFTDDLDKVSEVLFGLSTSGGQEYCGLVIHHSVNHLKWSKSDEDLKCIFIAGNEAFSQGPIDYKQACKAAIGKGITVSTIFCGGESQPVRSGWRQGALLADGSHMNLDQNQAVVAIKAPQDKRLAELSAKLNSTYLAYGKANEQQRFLKNQLAQDKNAATVGGAAAATRALSKASRLYSNSARDLVDATAGGKLKLVDIPQAELPKELQKLTKDELTSLIEKKRKSRATIQAEIQKLAKARNAYVVEQRAKAASGGAKGKSTLDEAIVRSVRAQASRKKFVFESGATPEKKAQKKTEQKTEKQPATPGKK